MTLTVHRDLVQCGAEWLAARCGLLTASDMKRIITPKLAVASNEAERAHLFELLAQRITRYVEPTYISNDMLRGQEDEIEARALYAQHYAPVQTCGLMVRDFGWGKIGYSPDGLVGDDGLIECKSRRQRFHVETICQDEMPADYHIQVQTGLLVSGRKWCDFISYSGGLPMCPIRVEVEPEVHSAILNAAQAFEERLAMRMAQYRQAIKENNLVATERRVAQEMFVL
ncbi:MAG: lambda exonuclease family protein [Erythrobacter sp.]|jgi:predicted phage-related endonuclease